MTTVKRQVAFISESLSLAIPSEAIKHYSSLDAAIARGGDPSVVLLDVRNSDGRLEDLRKLKARFGKAVLVALIEPRTPTQLKFNATKAGCDEFVSYSPEVTIDQILDKLVPTADTSRQRHRILVVDDDPNNRELLRQELMDENFDVLLAHDGPTGLSLAPKAHLVLLDIMMPGMSGRDVCKRLRADERFARLPVIMLSALSQMSDKLQALEMGANDYVSKPYDLSELVEKIQRQLWLRGAHEQLARSVKR